MKMKTENKANFIKILIVDDEQGSRESFQMLFESQGYAADTADSVSKALEMLKKEIYHLVVTDIMMPGCSGIELLQIIKERYADKIEVLMITGYGSIETAVETIKKGAFGYFIKGHDPEELLHEVKKVVIRIEMENMKLLKAEQAETFLTTSRNPRMMELWQMIDKVADSNASVLITGESGTGKEIVAGKLHRESKRKDGPFIPINCQQYPRDLIESELFGHEKGAYTGASAKRTGKLEQAAGGTVFLDEIGDISMDIQVKLLRVLEQKTFERIGSNKLIPVDFRLISATNKDMGAAMADGKFRQDLFYRINTIELHIPPLRERREDIPDFIDFFVRKFSMETGKKITEIESKTMDFLLNYDYIGNVRELKNMVERMVILAGKDGVLKLNMPMHENGELCHKTERIFSSKQTEETSFRMARQQFEKEFITNALKKYDGNITRTAQAVGLSRRQLFNKITELSIDTTVLPED